MTKKKINWYTGKNAINPADMQELCDNVEESTSPQNLAEIIKGSDEVVVDVAEDNETLEIHLDNNVSNKINKSLQLPNQTPTATELVAVGSNNAQTMLKIGDGLSVSDGTIKASIYSQSKPVHQAYIEWYGDIDGVATLASGIVTYAGDEQTTVEGIINNISFDDRQFYQCTPCFYGNAISKTINGIIYLTETNRISIRVIHLESGRTIIYTPPNLETVSCIRIF